MSKYIESESFELKEKYSDTICKEIVAFLNAEGGTILVGVNDSGKVVGVDKIDDTLRRISDIVTSQIEPNPQDEIRTELLFDQGKTLISLKVNKGQKNIYCQKKNGFSPSGCVIRIGTTCREMTPEQIRIRYEKNFYDDEYMLKKKASMGNLSFRELKIYYSEKGFHVDDSSLEANFNLKNADGDYNLLAELLSDKNNIPYRTWNTNYCKKIWKRCVYHKRKLKKLYLDPFMDLWILEILSYGVSGRPSAKTLWMHNRRQLLPQAIADTEELFTRIGGGHIKCRLINMS